MNQQINDIRYFFRYFENVKYFEKYKNIHIEMHL